MLTKPYFFSIWLNGRIAGWSHHATLQEAELARKIKSSEGLICSGIDLADEK